MTHLLAVPFTGLGLFNGYRGDVWLKNRIAVFKRFVLPSLLNQSNRDFILWIAWRPEEKNNHLVKELAQHIAELRDLQAIFTFGGCFFWDDKYSDDVAAKKLLTNLTNTLPVFRDIVEGEYVYMTIQPSDDLYFSNLVEDVRNWPSDNVDVMGYRNGYITSYATKELAEYNPDTKPPFFTIRFPRETFLDPQKHFDFTGPYKSHEYIGDKMRYAAWPERGFIVGTHGDNISTTFNHPYKGRIIEGEQKDSLLIHAGIFSADPLVTRAGWGLIGRKILNKLPGQDTLRSLYRKLPNNLQRL